MWDRRRGVVKSGEPRETQTARPGVPERAV
jgi:hypothetical protein